MALPSSGPLSLSQIQGEFGGSNPISISEYYAGGAYVAAGTSGTNGAVPSSGTIRISNFYGTTSFIPFGEAVYTTPGTYTYVVPAAVTSICVVAVGGGASVTTNGNSRDNKNGGGGGALSYTNNIPVTPGESLTVVAGNGGYGVGSGGTSSISRGGTVLVSAQGAPVSDGPRGAAGISYGVPGLAANGVGAVRNSGGAGGSYNVTANNRSGGGGGAAGYSGNGGTGGGAGVITTNQPYLINGLPGAGGGGGGGGAGVPSTYCAGGGGVGLYGQGSNGAGGASGNSLAVGGGGSGGTNGSFPPTAPNNPNSITGGTFGGGAGCHRDDNDEVYGRWGGLRIIWGTGKSYPFNAT